MKIHKPEKFDIIRPDKQSESMLAREDYLQVACACETIGQDLILPPHMADGGCMINGKEYLPIIMTEDPEIIKDAIIRVCDYFGIKVVEE